MTWDIDALVTPPYTPLFRPTTPVASSSRTSFSSKQSLRVMTSTSAEDADTGLLTPPESSPEFQPLPPTIVSPLDLDAPTLPPPKVKDDQQPEDSIPAWEWTDDLTPEEAAERQIWLSEKRGRAGLRVVIVTENFLPKVDGVTRTLARLLEHLTAEGHQCMLLGPGSELSSYAGHPLVGTAGIPLVVYPGLKLNFLRPKFLSTIKHFQPDIIHFVDPIWLGAQTMMAMELGWAGQEWVGSEGPALGAGVKGAVVASYHTNLATYATLFGLPKLAPVLWRFQKWLYSKTRLTLCPSPSTTSMLHSQGFDEVRLWPRGVDLSQFSPKNRSAALRASWGISDTAIPNASFDRTKPFMQQLGKLDEAKIHQFSMTGIHFTGRKASLPLTPPESPATVPADARSIPTALRAEEKALIGSDESPSPGKALTSRVVLLYVGRISWEKNLHLLLAAYAQMSSVLTSDTPMPKLVFVGDGPAKAELEEICKTRQYDAKFMGFREGKELAICYASADIFAFPSFTETFGQVVLEAMASGLPVVGLDAEGTRDLVKHEKTGLLLPLPTGAASWPDALKTKTSSTFTDAARSYAEMLAQAVTNDVERQKMAGRASTEGISGYTWWDAMEKCVDGYREALRMSLDGSTSLSSIPSSKGISRVNKVVSRRLAHKGAWLETNKAPARRPNTHSAILFSLATIALLVALCLALIYAPLS